MKFDFVVVGAGPFGGTFARAVADAGKRVLVIDRRGHIAGNCFDERIDGINVHRYGPHAFHTSNRAVWDFLNRFATFVPYEHRVRAFNRGRVFSMPINMSTLHFLWGVVTPDEARRKLREVAVPCDKPANLEQWIRAQVGDELYELCVKGYTEKQWGRPCSELPASIIKRLPIRLTYDDRYHSDPYQGLPREGYTSLYRNMLDGISVELGVDYLQQRDRLDHLAHHVVFTGPIDRFFNHEFGELEYRSLRFETERVNHDGIGCPQLNYTDAAVPYTRMVDWKHFERLDVGHSVLTREYPQACARGGEPYYPIRDAENTARYNRYAALARRDGKYLFGGRLASYAYLDMDMTIASALAMAGKVVSQPRLLVRHRPAAGVVPA